MRARRALQTEYDVRDFGLPGTAGNALSWVCPLHNLDYEHYLPIFFDGVRCTEDPYKFMARQVRLCMRTVSHVLSHPDHESSLLLAAPARNVVRSPRRARTSCWRLRAATLIASCLASRASFPRCGWLSRPRMLA